MNKTEALQAILLFIAAAVLTAALAFLYDKTQAVDLREQNEILGLLRELKDIDGRWDLDVVRTHSELAGADLPATNRAAAAGKALDSLRAAVQRTPSASVSAGLPELGAAILEKGRLVEKFRAENSAAQSALRELLRVSSELATQAAGLKPRPSALEQALATLNTTAPLYYWLVQDTQRTALEAASGQLHATVPDSVRENAAKLELAVQALIAAKTAEQALFTKLAFLTSGPRLDNLFSRTTPRSRLRCRTRSAIASI
jgi:hypothetical protein